MFAVSMVRMSLGGNGFLITIHVFTLHSPFIQSLRTLQKTVGRPVSLINSLLQVPIQPQGMVNMVVAQVAEKLKKERALWVSLPRALSGLDYCNSQDEPEFPGHTARDFLKMERLNRQRGIKKEPKTGYFQ
jgi:hypothetical protein